MRLLCSESRRGNDHAFQISLPQLILACILDHCDRRLEEHIFQYKLDFEKKYQRQKLLALLSFHNGKKDEKPSEDHTYQGHHSNYNIEGTKR